MKKANLFFTAVTSLFTNFKISAMDANTRNTIKTVAFDSYDEDENYDDSYDDTYTGKPNPTKNRDFPTSAWVKTSGYFVVRVVNAIGAAQVVEIFNSLNNGAFVTSTLTPTLNPFTFSNRSVANANSTIVFAANGDAILTTAAGAILTLSCSQIPYRTLLETLKFYRISIRETKMTFTNEPQLDQDINYTEKTFLGKNNTNTFTPRAFFKDAQFQSKQVTMTQPYIIDGERGLNFICNSGETMSFSFYLDKLQKS
jgi:hypothetical protein